MKSLLQAILTVAFLLLLGGVSLSQEREARRQFLGAIWEQEAVGQNTAGWKTWQDQGGLLKLTRELDAGKLANTETVRASVGSLVTLLGSGGNANVARVNEAMSAWLSILESASSTVDSESIATTKRILEDGIAYREAFQKDLQAQLARLDRSLKSTSDSGTGWREFLLWDSTNQLVADEPLTDEIVSAIETRWTLAQSHWNTLRFRYTAQSVLRAVVLARRASVSDLPTTVEHATLQLAVAEGELRQETTAALRMLDSLDLGASFSLPWHRSHSLPQARFKIRTRELLPHFSETIDETFRINDRFAGTPVRGTGRIQGNLSIDFLERVVPTWQVVFKGTSTSSTVGSNSGVTVNSSASATVNGTKTIEWREAGLIALPASANANATVQFGGISTGGSRGRRNAARSEVYSNRAAAERDTELAIRRSSIERLDTHTRRMLAPINQRYSEWFVRPVNDQVVFAPRVVTTSSDGGALWNCWYTQVEGLGISSVPDDPSDDSDWSLAMHETFLARHLAALVGQREVHMSELNRLFGGEMEDTEQESGSSTVFRLRQSEPVEVRFEQQAAYFKLHLEEFRSAQGNIVVPITIDLAYQFSLHEGEVQLTRTTAPMVQLRLEGTTTGRLQTLKRILIRHLARAFPEQTKLQITTPNEGVLPATILANASAFSLSRGWLQASGDFKTP